MGGWAVYSLSPSTAVGVMGCSSDHPMIPLLRIAVSNIQCVPSHLNGLTHAEGPSTVLSTYWNIPACIEQAGPPRHRRVTTASYKLFFPPFSLVTYVLWFLFPGQRTKGC